MSHPLHNTVYARLDAIANAEKITRAELAALSREALSYVMDTHDIDLVNRLIGVLTPVNRKVAILFFTHFLPWSVEKQDDKFSRFGKMSDKTKQVKKATESIADFLSDESNTIWTWADDHIEVEQKAIDLGGRLEKALDDAINGVDTDKQHGDAVSKADILKLVMKHITSEEMMDTLASLETEAEEQVQSVMADA
jgi:hypothetical protein